jgi:hypothetical protein
VERLGAGGGGCTRHESDREDGSEAHDDSLPRNAQGARRAAHAGRCDRVYVRAPAQPAAVHRAFDNAWAAWHHRAGNLIRIQQLR